MIGTQCRKGDFTVSQAMKELAIRMAIGAAGECEVPCHITAADYQAGFYRISFLSPEKEYECYVDVLNGNVMSMTSRPIKRKSGKEAA